MNRMTYTSLLVGMLIMASGGSAVQPGEFFVESDVDRPGMDYRNFDLPESRPELCQTACESAAECEAYTYVKPGIQGPQARCWLKSDVPDAVTNDCCITGLKGSLSIERDIDRPGRDIKPGFVLAEARPELCRTACIDEPQCAAYTYVKPGTQGGEARCWLKNGVPNPVANPCCVSGAIPPAQVSASTELKCPDASYKVTTGTMGGTCVVRGEGLDRTAECIHIEPPTTGKPQIIHIAKATCRQGCGDTGGSGQCGKP
jgi:hypothetical protein